MTQLDNIIAKKIAIFSNKVKKARIKYNINDDGFGEEIWIMAYELLEIYKVNTAILSKKSNTNTQVLNKWKRKMMYAEINIELEPELYSYTKSGRRMIPDARTQGFATKALINKTTTPADVAKALGISETAVNGWRVKYTNAYEGMSLLPPGYIVMKKNDFVFSREDADEVNTLFKENRVTEEFMLLSKRNGFLKEQKRKQKNNK